MYNNGKIKIDLPLYNLRYISSVENYLICRDRAINNMMKIKQKINKSFLPDIFDIPFNIKIVFRSISHCAF